VQKDAGLGWSVKREPPRYPNANPCRCRDGGRGEGCVGLGGDERVGGEVVVVEAATDWGLGLGGTVVY